MKSVKKQDLLRALPSVDQLLQEPEVKPFFQRLERQYVARCARQAVDEIRSRILSDGLLDAAQVRSQVMERFRTHVQKLVEPSLRPVINCTGIILHTGLGRAVLPPSAIEQALQILPGYCNLELDLESGKRGERTVHVENLLCELTGAEAACVVNNNAAAVLICLNTLANRKEVIISRGELIEIGGSFRIPEIIARSGARMVEVGTTNKTHPADFVNAIGPRTAGILHVHTSNYRIQGFTRSVSLAELVSIAKERGLFVLHDLGGGILVDLRRFGLPYEPVVHESVNAGADLTTFSGDKVLGGPQCGIIVGNAELVRKIKKNPLMRAVRCDKLTYALLEATLRLFLNTETLQESHPVLRMLSEPVDSVRQRAERIRAGLGALSDGIVIDLVESQAQAGSGTLPLESLPSVALHIRSQRSSIEKLARRLRLHRPAVIGYVQKEGLYLDCRTVLPHQVEALVEALKSCLNDWTPAF